MHKAIVAVVTAVEEIPGADKIHVVTVLGEKCVVGKDVGVGYVGCLFPEGLQLSEEYCYENNLHRNAELNKDKDKTGFFEASRRIRAQPFLKVKSTALFMPMTSLDYLGLVVLSVGDQFDSIDGHKICQKYFSEQTRAAKVSGQAKQAKKNFARLFDQHSETSQFKHNAGSIPIGAVIYFHSKKHGTSFRCAHTLVEREITSWQRKANYWLACLGIPALFEPKQEWDYVVGTRRVVLKDQAQQNFYGNEAFRWEVLEQLKPFMDKGVQIFGEIVGYVNGRPIMATHNLKSLKNKELIKKYGEVMTYSYGCKPHEYKFHIYRVTYMDQNENNIDLSQRQLEKWCKDRNLPCTLEIHPPVVYDGDEDKLRTLVEQLTEREDVLGEDWECTEHLTEGLVLRVEAGKLTPTFLKNKAYFFRVLEGLCAEVDVEDAS